MNYTRKMLSIALSVFLAIGVATQAWARDAEKNKWEVSAMGGGVFPKEDGVDAAGYFGGRLIYNINQYAGVGVESEWMSFDDEEDGIHYGDVNGVPLLANLIFRMPLEATENKLVPYVLGGVGVIFWDYDESSLLTSAGLSIEGDTSFAGKVGGGADYYLTDNVAIFAEGGYIWSDYEAEISAAGAVAAATLETDVAFVVGGLKVGF